MAYRALLEQDRPMKCIEHLQETIYEKSNGDVRFDLDLDFKVTDNLQPFQWPVAPEWAKIHVLNVLNMNWDPCMMNPFMM